jgi:tetratricopeptide (TPR) repeat protein
VLLGSGDVDGALRAADRSLQLHPEAFQPVIIRIHALSERGEHEAAITAAERLLRAHPDDPDARYLLAYALVRSGNDDPARRILAQMATGEHRSPMHAAWIHGLLGQADSAFVWLERARREQPGLVTAYLEAHFSPLWYGLHDDPRFDELLREYGLR